MSKDNNATIGIKQQRNYKLIQVATYGVVNGLNMINLEGNKWNSKNLKRLNNSNSNSGGSDERKVKGLIENKYDIKF
ncbi:hypothetical protein Glove_476g9 [Diversispora epigaea]|uniref:Uncharacterized protein n=1 Tax=Diversispora epigaea TaxID=1348612 RepID=A0A397GMX7_9GLOM|nr:hypothetical protein Glove_476g9 [Diversispora epigaea]